MNQASKQLLTFAVAAYATTSVAASGGSSRPRGVGPEFAKFYTDATTFSCISDPSIKIPFTAVNDDYCDCPDGSDEPGTAACSFISSFSPSFASDPGNGDANHSLVLPGFYCKNIGHTPVYIPFQRVNDGVCDYELCCDGSDEWARVGGLKCENKCKEIGKRRRAEEEAKQQAYLAALKNRKELAERSLRLRKEVEDRVAALEAEVAASEPKVQSLQTELDEIRAQNRGKVVKSKKGGVSELAGIAKKRVDDLQKALDIVSRQRDDHLSHLEELEGILSKFKEEYNPNFNDEGVKRAVRSWEEYAVQQEEKDGSADDSSELDEILKPGREGSDINWEQWENAEEETETSLVYQLAASLLPASLVNTLEDKFANIRSVLISGGVIAGSRDNSDSKEPPVVKEARDRLSNAQSTLESTKSQLREQKAELDVDFGVDSIFRALKGECISRDSGEYNYELCWMKQTKQKSKKGRGDTTMGKYARIGSTTVDEATSSGQIIPKTKVVLEYENGQSCWNGPSRSTKVILDCGEKNELTKITEDEKCVYSMFVTTPAVCELLTDANAGKAKGAKDEL